MATFSAPNPLSIALTHPAGVQAAPITRRISIVKISLIGFWIAALDRTLLIPFRYFNEPD